MANITIRNLDDDVKTRLRVRAAELAVWKLEVDAVFVIA